MSKARAWNAQYFIACRQYNMNPSKRLLHSILVANHCYYYCAFSFVLPLRPPQYNPPQQAAPIYTSSSSSTSPINHHLSAIRSRVIRTYDDGNRRIQQSSGISGCIYTLHSTLSDRELISAVGSDVEIDVNGDLSSSRDLLPNAWIIQWR